MQRPDVPNGPYASARLIRIAAAVFVAAVLSACGSQSGQGSQVVARVNDAELSIHQLNHVLKRTSGIAPERAAEARREILERLIDQELAVQKAREARLDRDPEILQRIEASRREVLARAHLERSAAQVPRPTAGEIDAFFKANPLLFSERRVWRLDEIVLSPAPASWPELSKVLEPARSVSEVASMLRTRGIDAPVNPGVHRASEAVPLEVLPGFAKLKEGDVAMYAAGGQAVIAQIRGVQSAPVEAKRPSGAIEQNLMNRRRGEATQAEIKRLREIAKIEYRGEFEGGATPSAARTGGGEPRSVDKSIEKGISGLR